VKREKREAYREGVPTNRKEGGIYRVYTTGCTTVVYLRVYNSGILQGVYIGVYLRVCT